MSSASKDKQQQGTMISKRKNYPFEENKVEEIETNPRKQSLGVHSQIIWDFTINKDITDTE